MAENIRAPRTAVFVSTIYPYPVDNGKKVAVAGYMRFLVEALGAENVTYVKIGELEPSAAAPFPTVTVSMAPAWRRLLSVAWHALLFRRKSLQEALLYAPMVERRLQACIATLDPDVVIMDTIRVAQFFERAVARAPGRRWVLYMEDLYSHRYGGLLRALNGNRALSDPLGAFAYAVPRPLRPLAQSRAAQALLYRFEASLVAAREQQAASTVADVCLVNGTEVSYLARRAPGARVWETPPLLATPAVQRQRDAWRHGPFVILGALDYQPNCLAVLDFLAEAMPAVVRELPHARIKIVGKGAPAMLLALAAKWSPHVELSGFVPDLASLMASAAAMIVPVKVGSGPKLKVLEALAHGLPLITTRNGIKAIPAVPDVHCFVSDDLSQFGAFMRSLQCPPINTAFSLRCRALFDSRYAREAAYPRYTKAFLGRD